MMTRGGDASRTKAFRDIVRDTLDRQSTDALKAACIATLSYLYNHATRDTRPRPRLAHAHHDHHDPSVASLHVHLDHDACLEVSVLRGASGTVEDFADKMATRGQACSSAPDSDSGLKNEP
jgi:CopG family nickel-responsive transcriptional regulator